MPILDRPSLIKKKGTVIRLSMQNDKQSSRNVCIFLCDDIAVHIHRYLGVHHHCLLSLGLHVQLEKVF